MKVDVLKLYCLASPKCVASSNVAPLPLPLPMPMPLLLLLLLLLDDKREEEEKGNDTFDHTCFVKADVSLPR